MKFLPTLLFCSPRKCFLQVSLSQDECLAATAVQSYDSSNDARIYRFNLLLGNENDMTYRGLCYSVEIHVSAESGSNLH